MPDAGRLIRLPPHRATTSATPCGKRGDWRRPGQSLERALVLDPAYAEAYGNLGNVRRDLGQMDAAIVGYRRALALRPGFAEAHYNLGNVLNDLWPRHGRFGLLQFGRRPRSPL